MKQLAFLEVLVLSRTQHSGAPLFSDIQDILAKWNES